MEGQNFVNLFPMLGVYGQVGLETQIVLKKEKLKTEWAVMRYICYMGSVNWMDSDIHIARCFLRKENLQKWYKNVYLGICDHQIFHGCVSWNMSANDPRPYFEMMQAS